MLSTVIKYTMCVYNICLCVYVCAYVFVCSSVATKVIYREIMSYGMIVDDYRVT